MTRLVDPILADLQTEHHEAVMRGSVWRARLAWLHALLALARVGAVHSLLERPWEERRQVRRALLVTAAAFVGFVGLICATFTRNVYLQVPEVVYIVPSVAPVAFPASLVCGIVFGLGEAQRRLLAPVLLLSLAACCASFFMEASMVPASNQKFREAVMAQAGRPKPLRGVNELTLSEVNVLRAAPARLPGTMPISLKELTFAYHARLSLACSPLVLVVSILSTSRRRRWPDAGIAVAIVLAHLAGPLWTWTPTSSAAGVWTPTAILLVMAAGALLLRHPPEVASQ